MIATNDVSIILKNDKDEFELYIADIDESEHEIEVCSEFIHPELQRGWVGDLIYNCHRGYEVSEAAEVKNVQLACRKNVLLRDVQCYSANIGEPTVWRYVFLKD